MTRLSFPLSPDQLFGNLFRDVQLGHIFSDSKTFVDCIPKLAPADLVNLYENLKQQPDFDLKQFVHDYFTIPSKINCALTRNDHVSDTSLSTAQHIHLLWNRLTRQADEVEVGSSHVPLPFPYIVPGGRFREIFYWDSYFTMLGLKKSGKSDAQRLDLIRGMVDNFAYLIDTFGFIPNGNRTYFLSRSQPPFFSLMVKLLAEIDGNATLVNYLPQLQREYNFWMDGASTLNDTINRRTVSFSAGNVLNRYWDDTPTPRPESYREEIELVAHAEPRSNSTKELYTHIRAACESGWDFSSRWFSDQKTLAAIHTADIIPVDLNCLLYDVEITLRDAYQLNGQPDVATTFDQYATSRKQLIQSLFWNNNTQFFHDYDVVTKQPTPAVTLAGVFPMYFGIATPEQATLIHDKLRSDFLQAGGWVTTLNQTGQQWDWPNGWAPLQWIVYQSLLNYGFTETAQIACERWLALNDKVFKATGKMMEKYNVVDASLTTGGGEYPNQDGFGWTNGVYLAMSNNRIVV